MEEPRKIHILHAQIQKEEDIQKFLPGLKTVLSPEELARTKNQSRDRHAFFVAGRFFVRWFLGSLIGVPPKEIQIDAEIFEKPKFIGKWVNCGWYFNITHAPCRIQVAATTVGSVGIDIEWMKLEVDELKIARALYHPEEIAYLENLQGSPQFRKEFLQMAAMKDAYRKSQGWKANQEVLSSFSVLDKTDGICLLGDKKWFTTPIPTDSSGEYIAALCGPTPIPELVFTDFDWANAPNA